MPYRNGLKSTAGHCYRHPVADAEAICDRCHQSVCAICVVYVRTTVACPSCAGRVRTVQFIKRSAVLVAGALALVLLGLFLRSLPTRFDYGARMRAVALAKEGVLAERCSRDATVGYENELVRAGDYRGALRDVDEFVAQCGDWYRVHWTAYTAHSRLNETNLAIAEATKLIEHNPADADYRWWRGILYEEQGAVEPAIADYRAAIERRPTLSSVPFNLAALLMRSGRGCEAHMVISDYLRYHAESLDDAEVQAGLSQANTLCARETPNPPLN